VLKKEVKKMRVNIDEYLRNRIRDKEALSFLLQVLHKEEAVKVIRRADIRVIRDNYIELEETNCYRHVNVIYGKSEIVDEIRSTCQDGPDIWTVYIEKIRIYAPAIIEHYKEPDRVYGGWREIIILLPKGDKNEGHNVQGGRRALGEA
jgi:predicted ATP-dependent Lon-type protease